MAATGQEQADLIPARSDKQAGITRRDSDLRSESRTELRTVAAELASIEAHLRRVEAKMTCVLDGVHGDWMESTLLALDSKVYAAFLAMEKATYADGALSRKTKELVAVSISVVTDCESCMQWHIEQAAKAGAVLREILEAVEVGIEMGGGPATVSARFALEVMGHVFGDLPG